MDWTFWVAVIGALLLIGLWAYVKDHLQRRARRAEPGDVDKARGLHESADQVERGRRAANLGWPTE